MADIFPLKPADKEKLHPCAWMRMDKWKAEIASEIPQMTNVSLAQFKKDAIKFLFQKEQKLLGDTKAKIKDWLEDCIISEVYSDSPFIPEIDQYMFKIKGLLKAIYQRKEQAIKEERQRAEYEVQRRHVMETMQPLILDAKAYLEADEYKAFENSIPGAVDAFIEIGSGYYLDGRASNFASYLIEIQNRKKQKELLQAAKAEAEIFNSSLLKEIEKLKSTLCQKKDAVEYFKENVTDPRYLGYEFSDVFNEDKLQDSRNSIQKIMCQKLESFIAVDLRDFIDSKCNTDFFLLPSASYSFDQIPCLYFVFDVFAVVSVEI